VGVEVERARLSVWIRSALMAGCWSASSGESMTMTTRKRIREGVEAASWQRLVARHGEALEC